MDARLRQLRTPRRGEDFDAWAFVAVQGSLYLVVGCTGPRKPHRCSPRWWSTG
jgi:hypothetical protein